MSEPMFKVRYSYLPQQFGDVDDLFEELKRFVPSGDFTLGEPLARFEEKFADLIGSKYAFGVGSGTDALKLGLKAVGVGHGDEVITAANTFIASVGAINELGAKPVFVDVDDSFGHRPPRRTDHFVPLRPTPDPRRTGPGDGRSARLLRGPLAWHWPQFSRRTPR